MTEKRAYGEEREGDVYPRACTGSVCRMARFNRDGHGCPGEIGGCKLEAREDREGQCRSAYLDNRRGILRAMKPENGLTATVTRAKSRGLPEADPVTVGLSSLKPFDDGRPPCYVVRAEGIVVDGPHQLTLQSLMTRLDGPPVRPKPKKPGSSAGNPSARR